MEAGTSGTLPTGPVALTLDTCRGDPDGAAPKVALAMTLWATRATASVTKAVAEAVTRSHTPTMVIRCRTGGYWRK